MGEITFAHFCGFQTFEDSWGRTWKIRVRPLCELPEWQESLTLLFADTDNILRRQIFIRDNATSPGGADKRDLPPSDFRAFVSAIVFANLGETVEELEAKPERAAPEELWIAELCLSLLKEHGICPKDTLSLTVPQITMLSKAQEAVEVKEFKNSARELPKKILDQIEGRNKIF